jgi:hypothetical protein
VQEFPAPQRTTVPDEPAPGRREPDPPYDKDPSLLSIIGLVAFVVAAVILVFFAIGYLFGRLFL